MEILILGTICLYSVSACIWEAWEGIRFFMLLLQPCPKPHSTFIGCVKDSDGERVPQYCPKLHSTPTGHRGRTLSVFGVKSMCYSIASNFILLLEDIQRTLRDTGFESVGHSLAPNRILLLEDIWRTLRDLGVKSVHHKPYPNPCL